MDHLQVQSLELFQTLGAIQDVHNSNRASLSHLSLHIAVHLATEQKRSPLAAAK